MSTSRKPQVVMAVAACALVTALILVLSRDDGASRAVPSIPPSKLHAGAAGSEAALVGETDVPSRSESRLAEKDAETPADASAMATPLAEAEEELAFHAIAGLDGVLYINEVLDLALEFASLPVEEHPDLEYEDNDAITYKLAGAPEGMEARLFIGLQPYQEDGRTFRYLQLGIQSNRNAPEYLLGAMRDGPNLHLGISYAVDDEYTPTRFALLLQRRVDLAASREAGIDAYQGRYTGGAMFWVDLLKAPQSPTTTTMGIIDGNPADTMSFGGISPLAGDLALDTSRLAELLEKLQIQLAAVKGE